MTNPAVAWAREELNRNQTLEVVSLPVEASFRTFYRLRARGSETGTVLMVSPPEKENNDRFESFSRIFAAVQIPVPEILAADRSRGWYLLTDLGNTDLESLYGTADQEPALEAAVSTLVRLQAVRHRDIPPYTRARLSDELEIFNDWFVEQLLGESLPHQVQRLFERLVDRIDQQDRCCVHRDYHCRNLLFDPATGRFGVVDFQDALMGPVAYDLASLLYDCYHRFDDATIEHWTARYLERSPLSLDGERFREDLALTAVQRQLKAAGIFVRLKMRDGRNTHLQHVPAVVARVIELCRNGSFLAPLGDWLEGLGTERVDRALTAAANG